MTQHFPIISFIFLKVFFFFQDWLEFKESSRLSEPHGKNKKIIKKQVLTPSSQLLLAAHPL